MPTDVARDGLTPSTHVLGPPRPEGVGEAEPSPAAGHDRSVGALGRRRGVRPLHLAWAWGAGTRREGRPPCDVSSSFSCHLGIHTMFSNKFKINQLTSEEKIKVGSHWFSRF